MHSFSIVYLTPNTPLIHTSFTYSKWNMAQSLFMRCTYTTKSFIEIHPCPKKVFFITEFAILGIFMGQKKIVLYMEEFQNIF